MTDNYDDTQFIVRSIHFCGGDKKEFEAWCKGLGNLFNSSAKTRKKVQDTRCASSSPMRFGKRCTASPPSR